MIGWEWKHDYENSTAISVTLIPIPTPVPFLFLFPCTPLICPKRLLTVFVQLKDKVCAIESARCNESLCYDPVLPQQHCCAVCGLSSFVSLY